LVIEMNKFKNPPSTNELKALPADAFLSSNGRAALPAFVGLGFCQPLWETVRPKPRTRIMTRARRQRVHYPE